MFYFWGVASFPFHEFLVTCQIKRKIQPAEGLKKMLAGLIGTASQKFFF